MATPVAYGSSQARGPATATVGATLNSSVVSHTGSPFFFPWRAAPAARGGPQARGLVGAVAPGQRHSHNKHHSSQQPTERGQGSNPQPHGS